MRTFDDLEKANASRKLLREAEFSEMTELQYHHHMIAINFEEIAKLKRKMKSLKKKIKKATHCKEIAGESVSAQVESSSKPDVSTCCSCKEEFTFDHEMMKKWRYLGFKTTCFSCAVNQVTDEFTGKIP